MKTRKAHKPIVQVILGSLFVFAFFFVGTSVQAGTMQDVINQNDSLVVNQPDQTKTESATSSPVTSAVAVTSIVKSGTFGSCNWDIDDTGLLTIHAGVLGAGAGNWDKNSVTSIYVDPGVEANSNSGSLFSYFSNVVSIDVSNLNTSNVTNFSDFFFYDLKLQNITGIENFDTSKATDMRYMFASISSLKSELDVSHFDTSNVTLMNYMFNGCKANIIGLSSFNTSKVTAMNYMLNGTNISDFTDIGNFDMSNVTTVANMLSGMTKLTSVDISKWNKSKITNISGLFSGDSSLTDINGLADWDVSNVTDMSSLFYNTRLTDLSDIDNWNTENVTNMSMIFSNCIKLNGLNLINWNTSKVTDMSSMFSGDSNLNDDNLSGIENFDTKNVTNMAYMFNGTGFKILDLSNFQTDKVTDIRQMFYNTKSLIRVIGKFKTPSLTMMSFLFSSSSISDLSRLNLSDWDTSKVTTMSNIFSNTSLTDLSAISGWDTGSVTDFSSAFSQMKSLTTLDISKWNTESATNMRGMFSGDNRLTELDVSNFKTDKVTDISSMFNGDNQLSNIDVSKWNTENVNTMNGAFYSCGKLNKLDVSNWNTSKVTNMDIMFQSDSQLGKLNLSKWDMSNVTSMKTMLNGTGLWQISLGPKTFFTDDMAFPIAKTNGFTDVDTNTDYSGISDHWQVVDEANGGTVHEPVGKLVSNEDLASLYSKMGGPTATYVWQQQPYMDMKMDVPDLSFHKVGSNKVVAHRQEDNWGITVTNNVFPAQSVKSDIKVKISKPLTDADGDVINNALIFRDYGKSDQTIGTDDTTLATRTFPMNDSTVTWNRNYGFLMNFDGSTIKSGDYSGTLTWTLQNSL
ncbi:BspA family leucine-rich repeat surface protein [Companilactobacillus kedongensis]|uniref:BspA family leucine-rich repeat surface protein n=1 Tax=Companilactobacillus kedongensis TaxID=2486004 RepID=UPI000F788732|nr:BspA family leucine-rich repeat surface protein [Companilactobacillus kedongensis]